MITDRLALDEIRKDWEGVEKLSAQVDNVARWAFGSAGSMANFLNDAAQNLPFLHASGVLNNVLAQLRDEGAFRSGGRTLGHLLNDSQNALPWTNYALVREGVDRRNKVAHEGELLSRHDCRKHINAIRDELRGWRILD
jgi:hypothetical protein